MARDGRRTDLKGSSRRPAPVKKPDRGGEARARYAVNGDCLHTATHAPGDPAPGERSGGPRKWAGHPKVARPSAPDVDHGPAGEVPGPLM